MTTQNYDDSGSVSSPPEPRWYCLSIEGLCSLGNNYRARILSVTCKTGPDSYKKHYLGLSDNVSFVVEQVDGNKADPSQYRVVFKPAAVVSNVEIRQ